MKRTPEPKPTAVVCSICDQPWDRHKADAKGKVDLLACVAVLKAELAKRPRIGPWSNVVGGANSGYTITNATN